MITNRQRMRSLAYRLTHIMQIAVVWMSAHRIKPFSDAEIVAFAKHASYGFKPDNELLVQALRFHHSERRLDESKMADIAKLLADGDEVVEEILLWNMYYQGGRIPSPPYKHRGVYFWIVGHNASHQFSAGTRGDGKRYSKAAGESANWDGVTGSPEIEVSMRQVEDFSGYYGHF